MYALVEIAGKQYKAEEGAVLHVDLLENEKGSSIDFDSVLLTSKDGDVKVGTPYVKGAKVQVSVEDVVKGDKVVVFKYKRRKDYRRTQGHRQQFSVLKVTSLTGV